MKATDKGLKPMQRGNLTEAEWTAPTEYAFKCTGCTPHRYFSQKVSRRDYHLVHCPLRECDGVIIDVTEELKRRNKEYNERQKKQG